MATQSIEWQSNNVVLVHYTEKGGISELQRVTQLSTATEVEPIENSLRGSRSLPAYACYAGSSRTVSKTEFSPCYVALKKAQLTKWDQKNNFGRDL